MVNDQVKLHGKHGSPFAIQLFECALVAVLFYLSFVFAGKLIYNNAFPFGWIDGVLHYTIMTAIAIIMLGANKYFSFISRPISGMMVKVVGLVIMMNFIFIALLYFNRSIRLSPYYFIVNDTLQILVLLLIKRITYLLKTNIFKNRVSLVIGKNWEKNQILRELSGKSAGRLSFVSYDDERLKEFVDKADNVFVTGLLSKRLKDRIISYCILKDKKVFIVPETYEIAMRKAEMTRVGDIPLFAIESFQLTEVQNLLKRLMDIVLAIFGILLSSPLMLFAAIRIKIEDGGPIFYRQIRSGLNGKEFRLIKFRSMVVDAEKNTGAVFAVENDPRITKIGRLIRSIRIDEIPQFFNVLAGSMSMIGPRPERPQFVDEFSRELPDYAGRLAVKPGITGLAQVMGNYTTSAENKAKFDLVYIRDYSIFLDIKIIFKTMKVVFTKSQSKGFSAHKSEGVWDLEMELADENRFSGVRKSAGNHRLGKAALGLFCSSIIISGCMVLRYSALTSTMMEAAAQTVLTQTAVQAAVIVPEADEESLDYTMPEPTAIEAANAASAAETGDNSEVENDTTVKPDTTAEDDADGETYLADIKSRTLTEQLSQSNQDVILSNEQINSAMDKMSMSERMGIAYDLISRMNAEDLIRLDKLAEGGFTKEEKAAAKDIMYRYFDNTEVGYIKEIYWEYVE